jgi:glycine oxidase
VHKTNVDYLVVGGGLAGSCLTIQLIRQGNTVALFDQPGQNRASSIAAGLFNPITNQVMNKTWRADEIFESLNEFYTAAEQFLAGRFYFPLPVYRPFASIEEQNSWMARSASPGIEKFIDSISASERFGDQVHGPHGGILLRQSGYVDVTAFTASVKDFLMKQSLLFHGFFDFQKLKWQNEVHYENLSARCVIFCEGTGIQKNPFFSWLPVNSLKGETLDILPGVKPELIYNKGVYLVPGKAGTYKVGATYQRQSKEGITMEGRQELVQKLNELVRFPYQIVKQDWGFRPTTIDRRPVLGPHPKHANLAVFNGLGTKGVSLAPHFSGVMARWLNQSAQIEKEVNISRFYALYS